MWPKSVTPMAGRLEQLAWMRRRPLMPLALKHSWAGKRRERDRPLPLPPPCRSHTHTELSATAPGGAEGGVSRPGRQPRTWYWGKPSCATHSATSSALQVRKGQTARGPPPPSGSGCGLSAVPVAAGPGRGSTGPIPGRCVLL